LMFKYIPFLRKQKMFDTPESAATWFNVFNGVLVFAAILVAVGTWGTVRTGAIKERFSDERISVNEAQTKRAVAESDKANAALAIAQSDIVKANARIAEAEARAKEAELKLEQVRERMRARHIKGDTFRRILEGKPKASVEILFVRDDGEAFQLALEIRDWLKRASWDVAEPRPIMQSDLAPRLAETTPSTMAVGGQPQGVSVFLRAESQADFAREFDDARPPNGVIDTPRKALSAALGDSLGSISGGMSYEIGSPGVLRVIVGPKPSPL